MKRIVTWALALTLALGFFAPGAANAHVKTFRTRVKFTVSDASVSDGQRVTFSGSLKARNRKCVRSKTITIKRRARVVATVTTNRRGKYSVSKRVRRGGPYRAVYSGYSFGAHPHSHLCRSRTSRTVRIGIT